jgi:hypothetical protein
LNCSIVAGRFALLLLTAAAPLIAQDSRLADRFPPALAARLSAAVDSASRDDLPAEPLVLRALEGQAKGATADQIVAAVIRLREVLRTARTTLGTAAASTEMTTAAAALQAGMPQFQLAELHKLRGALPVTAPLNAYLDLTAHGTPADRAWTRISELARKRAGDGEFVRLGPADIGHDSKPTGPTTLPTGKGSP